MNNFKSFLIENHNDKQILSYLEDLFKHDAKFLNLLKKAHTDADTTKIVEYITSKYSIELEKLMKKYHLSPIDLATYINKLKGEKSMRITKEFLDIKKENSLQEDEAVITPQLCNEITSTFFDVINQIDVDEDLDAETQNNVYFILHNLDNMDNGEGTETGTANESEKLDEFTPIKKKINAKEKLANKQYYRQHKNKIKMALKKYKKSAKFKQYQRKATMMAKQGKTATGKKKTTFV